MNMNQETVIQKTIDFVKEILSDAEGGHDWWHIYRVWKLSKHIAQTEKVDNFVVELGALLHDILKISFQIFHSKVENILKNSNLLNLMLFKTQIDWMRWVQ